MIYLDQLVNKLDEYFVYIKNYNVVGIFNEVFILGFNYNSFKYWFVNINFNYFNGIWLDFFFECCMLEVVFYMDDLEVIQQVVMFDLDLWNSILDQECMFFVFMVDLFGGKLWKINDFFIYFNVGVNNLLDK